MTAAPSSQRLSSALSSPTVMMGGPSEDWLGTSLILYTPAIGTTFTHYLLRPRFVPFLRGCIVSQCPRSYWKILLGTNRPPGALSPRMMGGSNAARSDRSSRCHRQFNRACDVPELPSHDAASRYEACQGASMNCVKRSIAAPDATPRPSAG